MGTILASAILGKASTTLLDPANTRWPQAELLAWLSEAQRQVVQYKPSANNVVAAVKLTSGARQAIPVSGWTLLGVIRNMGTNGATPGQAIKVASHELLGAFNPTWNADTPSATTQNFLFDLQDQTAYYVYPPSDGTGYVEVNYSAVPADIASVSTAITLHDVFEPTLLNYVLFRANSKDSKYAAGMQAAQAYHQAFLSGLNLKDQAEMENNPNIKLGQSNMQVRGGAE